MKGNIAFLRLSNSKSECLNLKQRNFNENLLKGNLDSSTLSNFTSEILNLEQRNFNDSLSKGNLASSTLSNFTSNSSSINKKHTQMKSRSNRKTRQLTLEQTTLEVNAFKARLNQILKQTERKMESTEFE